MNSLQQSKTMLLIPKEEYENVKGMTQQDLTSSQDANIPTMELGLIADRVPPRSLKATQAIVQAIKSKPLILIPNLRESAIIEGKVLVGANYDNLIHKSYQFTREKYSSWLLGICPCFVCYIAWVPLD